MRGRGGQRHPQKQMNRKEKGEEKGVWTPGGGAHEDEAEAKACNNACAAAAEMGVGGQRCPEKQALKKQRVDKEVRNSGAEESAGDERRVEEEGPGEEWDW